MNKDNNTLENLYQNSKKESSPVSLDNLIIAAAKQSCETQKPQTKSNTAKKRWYYAISTAAVMVLGISMIINIQNPNDKMMQAPVALPQISTETQTQENKQEFEFDEELAPLEPHTSVSNSNVHRMKKSLPENLKPVVEADATQLKLLPKKVAKPQALKPIRQAKDKPNLAAIADSLSKESEKTNADIIAEGYAERAEKEEDDSNRLYIEAETDVETASVRAALEPRRKQKDAPVELQRKLKKLTDLIAAKQTKEARQLLKSLQEKYPNYDFSVFQKLLE